MPTKLSQAIWNARRQTHLTQASLGQRVGVKASTILRWEAGRSRPPARRRPALVSAITALDANAGARLLAALNADAGLAAPEPPPRVARVDAAIAAPAGPATSPAASPPAARSTLELLVYRMADELDLPPRRMRGALTRWLRSVRAAGLSFEQAERELGAWLARVA